MVKYIVGIGLYMLKYSVLQHNFLDWDLFTELIRMKIYNMHYALCRLYFYKMRDRRHFFGLTTLSRCRKSCPKHPAVHALFRKFLKPFKIGLVPASVDQPEVHCPRVRPSRLGLPSHQQSLPEKVINKYDSTSTLSAGLSPVSRNSGRIQVHTRKNCSRSALYPESSITELTHPHSAT